MTKCDSCNKRIWPWTDEWDIVEVEKISHPEEGTTIRQKFRHHQKCFNKKND